MTIPSASEPPPYALNMPAQQLLEQEEASDAAPPLVLAGRPSIVAMAVSGGCGYVRLTQPCFLLSRHPRYRHDWRIVIAERFEHLEGAAVVIMQRSTRGIAVDKVEAMRRRLGFKLIHELDDDVWNIPEWNPAKGIFDSCGEKLFYMERAIAMADENWVSTPHLMHLVHRFTKKPIIVIPNALDLRFWQQEQDIQLVAARAAQRMMRRDGRIRVGWSGSPTHCGDWDAVWPAIHAIDEMRHDITWVFQSYLPTWTGGLRNPVEFHDSVGLMVYPTMMWLLDLDIALAPLQNIKFNWSKSNLKLLEYWACSYAVVASEVEPYKMIHNGSDGYACPTHAKFVEKVNLLCDRPDLRQKLGANGRARLEREYDLLKINELRAQRLRALIA